MNFEDGEKKPMSFGPWGGQNIRRTLVQSHQFVANGHDQLGGFSVIQGSLGQSYDIVLAVRQNGDGSNALGFQNKPVGQNSHPREFNELGTKDKVGVSKVQLPKVERPKEVPSKEQAPKELPKTLPQKDKVQLPKEFPPKEQAPKELPKSLPQKDKVGVPKVQFAKELPPNEQAPKELPKLLPPKVAGSLTFGPWGGNGGATFDDGVYKGIRQIKLSRNVGIVWMKVMYDEDGEAKWGSKHGGVGGYKSDKIVFDYPSEILTHITGTMGPLMYMGPTITNSLTFYTNKAKYGPFGEEQGPSFTSKVKEGKIVGFHGREGLFLDALGVHVMEGKAPTPTRTPPPTTATTTTTITTSTVIVPKETKPITTSTVIVPKETKSVAPPQWSNKLAAAKGFPTEDVSCGIVKEPAPCGPGPWGGDGGKAWDDGVFSGIKQIFLTRGEAICSLQIEFDRNGQSLWSVRHGGHGGVSTHRIKLEYPREVLVCISGYYGSISKDERPKVIRSLTFHTSKGKYGPYGEEVGTYFTSTATEGKVVGFHGRSSTYLDAIGVHMQHWPTNQKKLTKPSLFWKIR